MTRTRLLNFVAIGLIVLIVLVFAATAIPGVGQQAATPTAATATPESTQTDVPTDNPTEAPIELTATPMPTPTIPLEPLTVNLSEPFELQMGQLATLSDEQLSVQISSIEDSRCPLNVECVQAGSAIVDLLVTVQGESMPISITLEGGMNFASTIIEGYEIAVLDVIPYPGLEVIGGPPIPTVSLLINQALTD